MAMKVVSAVTGLRILNGCHRPCDRGRPGWPCEPVGRLLWTLGGGLRMLLGAVAAGRVVHGEPARAAAPEVITAGLALASHGLIGSQAGGPEDRPG